MNEIPKPGMLFTNSLLGALYLIVDVQYRKQIYFESYYIVYALGYNNIIITHAVPTSEINNLFCFSNWKLVE